MKSRVGSKLEKAVRFFPVRLTMLFMAGVVVSGAFLNLTIFYLPGAMRVAVAIVFMTFATGMILSMTQFATNAAFGIFEVFNWRYKVEKTHDPDADSIAEAIGAPKPKSINITDNPKVIAVTNAWSRVITVSRTLTESLTREELLAVITHELGHLKHRKRLLVEVALAMLATLGFSLYFLNIIILISPEMGILGEWAFLMLVLIPILRYNEIRADGETKLVKLNTHLADVLGKLDKGKGHNDGSETHPGTQSRIKRLLTPAISIPTNTPFPRIGFLDKIADVNWEVSFTTPYRYRINGILNHTLDYAIARGLTSITILDVGCSKGVAAKTLKSDLAKKGIRAKIIGVDLAAKVRKNAEKNLDAFYGIDILQVTPKELPLADVVICSYAAVFVTGDRRANMIQKCAEQLQDEGVLVTNAFPFRQMSPPTPAEALCHEIGSMKELSHGWRSFMSDFSRRRGEIAKRRTSAIRGRAAAIDYAEDIRKSWEALPEKKRQAWKQTIIMTGWDYHLQRLLRYVSRKIRNETDGVI
jgi:Zn-dependent protease with chaperone function/2-polyprenyl-3-methyl-5-hydroxy-6-metoxy-1,4-benzoquinol methylase